MFNSDSRTCFVANGISTASAGLTSLEIVTIAEHQYSYKFLHSKCILGARFGRISIRSSFRCPSSDILPKLEEFVFIIYCFEISLFPTSKYISNGVYSTSKRPLAEQDETRAIGAGRIGSNPVRVIAKTWKRYKRPFLPRVSGRKSFTHGDAIGQQISRIHCENSHVAHGVKWVPADHSWHYKRSTNRAQWNFLSWSRDSLLSTVQTEPGTDGIRLEGNLVSGHSCWPLIKI